MKKTILQLAAIAILTTTINAEMAYVNMEDISIIKNDVIVGSFTGNSTIQTMVLDGHEYTCQSNSLTIKTDMTSLNWYKKDGKCIVHLPSKYRLARR